MDFEFSAEQVAIRDTIRELVQDRVAPRAAEIDQTAEYPKDIEQLFAAIFTRVGGQARTNLAHVMADNSVAAWNPGADSNVNTIEVSGFWTIAATDTSAPLPPWMSARPYCPP